VLSSFPLTKTDPTLDLGQLLLFSYGIDLSKDIARNCGVTANVDWTANTIFLKSQGGDLIAKAVARFNKLEELYALFLHAVDLMSRTDLRFHSSICRLCVD